MVKLLFVCLGNICRSPAAEAVMNKLIAEAGLAEHVYSDSAGTGGWHSGERADSRMRAHGEKRGYDLTSRARQVDAYDDFDQFDLILAMDKENFRNLIAIAPGSDAKSKIRAICSYCSIRTEQEVPDPYHGGPEGFDQVIDILEDACQGLLAEIRKDYRI